MITEDATKKALSANIARVLEERGRTAYSLMKELGLKPGFYGVLRGECVPSVLLVARIADALDVTIDELLNGIFEKVAE